MKLLLLIAFTAFCSAGRISELDISDERVISEPLLIGATVNRTIESIKGRLAKYDPIVSREISKILFDRIEIAVNLGTVRGFSDFTLTSFSSSILRRTVSASVRIPKISSSLGNLRINYKEKEATSVAIELSVEDITVEVNAKYDRFPTRVTAISVLPQIGELKLTIGQTSWNDRELQIELDRILRKINKVLASVSERIENILITIINSILSRDNDKMLN